MINRQANILAYKKQAKKNTQKLKSTNKKLGLQDWCFFLLRAITLILNLKAFIDNVTWLFNFYSLIQSKILKHQVENYVS